MIGVAAQQRQGAALFRERRPVMPATSQTCSGHLDRVLKFKFWDELKSLEILAKQFNQIGRAHV